jgi:hypothetical protein
MEERRGYRTAHRSHRGVGGYIGRGNIRAIATRMTASIGAAALVGMAPVVSASSVSASASDVPPPDKTALLMGGTTIPTWNDADVAVIMGQFIAPTHSDHTIAPVAVTTPQEFWPVTGLGRLGGKRSRLSPIPVASDTIATSQNTCSIIEFDDHPYPHIIEFAIARCPSNPRSVAIVR